LADGFVGGKITEYLINNYKDDIAHVVTVDRNYITAMCNLHKISTSVEGRPWRRDLSVPEIDLGVLAWWPNIIHEPLLNYPTYGFVNTHPSFLPFGRGKHPSFWAIVEKSKFGVTLHMVDKFVDHGAIIAQERIPFDWTDTGETLYNDSQLAMIKLFRNTYPKMRKLRFKVKKQTPGTGKLHLAGDIIKASKIDLDKEYKARTLLNMLRAKTSSVHGGCRFVDNGEEYEITTIIRRV
jgi:methionyl-tRNA formyltransferase